MEIGHLFSTDPLVATYHHVRPLVSEVCEWSTFPAKELHAQHPVFQWTAMCLGSKRNGVGLTWLAVADGLLQEGMGVRTAIILLVWRV